MARITSIKELQATCDGLYAYFVERLAQVTEIERVDRACGTYIYLHIVKTKYCDNCLTIVKGNNGFIYFFADNHNGLMVGTISDLNAIEITTGKNLGWKKYTNKNGQKNADLKKRTILLDLQKKLEVLFKDYL